MGICIGHLAVRQDPGEEEDVDDDDDDAVPWLQPGAALSLSLRPRRTGSAESARALPRTRLAGTCPLFRPLPRDVPVPRARLGLAEGRCLGRRVLQVPTSPGGLRLRRKGKGRRRKEKSRDHRRPASSLDDARPDDDARLARRRRHVVAARKTWEAVFLCCVPVAKPRPLGLSAPRRRPPAPPAIHPPQTLAHRPLPPVPVLAPLPVAGVLDDGPRVPFRTHTHTRTHAHTHTHVAAPDKPSSPPVDPSLDTTPAGHKRHPPPFQGWTDGGLIHHPFPPAASA
ncbi:hypothetical protein CDD83_2792 [Cordyceps sp. RAO-2017]|nr:hypothetical protein CDD83_2792 [Cordyceps sp. RAO-2017]